jgi:protein O-mannosyl-transferase
MKKAEGRMKKAEALLPPLTARLAAQSQVANRKSEIFWLPCVLLGLATVALYWPATRCDFIVIDDAFNVTGNVPVLKGLTWEGVKLFFFNPWAPPAYTPVTMLSHMVVAQLCGLNPAGHHMGNVLVHALNAALVFAWLRLMTGATWRSLLVAALFAVHPLRVEPVLWVTERRELVCACFGLLTLIAYVRYAQSSKEQAESRKQKVESGGGLRSLSHLPASIFYLLAVGFYACGVLSKPTLVTWPFVILLLDYWPLRRLDVSRLHAFLSTLFRLVLEKIPFFVLSIFMSAMYAVGHELSRSFTWGGNHPFGGRLGNAVYSYGWYLLKLLWPSNLAVIYLHPGYWPLMKVVLAGGLILGVSVLAGLGWRRRPWLLVGGLWYCGALVPNSQLLQSGVLARADRWTYLPLIGVLILIVWGACDLVRGKEDGRRMRDEGRSPRDGTAAGAARLHNSSFIIHPSLLWVAGAAAIVLFMGLTRCQIGYWKDSETLLEHSLAVTGSHEVPLTFLGTALAQKGQIEEAIRQYQAALRLNPDFAPAHTELGSTLVRKGQVDQAIVHFQEALRIEPGYTVVHFNLGNAFLEKGQTDEAIREYQEALRRRLWLSLDDPNLHNNLGLAFARKGQPDEAIREYQQALRLQPEDPDIHFNLGAVLARRGQLDEAIRHYQETLRLQPDRAEAHNNLGTAFYQQGRIGEAVHEFQEALRLKPDYADARKNLMVALAASANPSPAPATPTNR